MPITFSSITSPPSSINVSLTPAEGEFSSLAAAVNHAKTFIYKPGKSLTINIAAGIYLNQQGCDLTGIPNVIISCPDRLDAALVVSGNTTVTTESIYKANVTIPVNNTSLLNVGDYAVVVPNFVNYYDPLPNPTKQELFLLGTWKVVSKTLNSITLRIPGWTSSTYTNFISLVSDFMVGAVSSNRLKICKDPVSLRMSDLEQITKFSGVLTTRHLQVISGESLREDYHTKNPTFLIRNCTWFAIGCSFGGETDLMETSFGGSWQPPVTCENSQIKFTRQGTSRVITVFCAHSHYWTYASNLFVNCRISSEENDYGRLYPFILVGQTKIQGTVCEYEGAICTGFIWMQDSNCRFFAFMDLNSSFFDQGSYALILHGKFKQMYTTFGTNVEIVGSMEVFSEPRIVSASFSSIIHIPSSVPVTGVPAYSPSSMNTVGNNLSLISNSLTT